MPSYRPFIVRIAQPVDGAYPVTAEFHGLAACESIPVPVLQTAPGALPAQLPEDMHEYERAAGGQLFHALFRGEILALFREAGKWLGPGERVRIVLADPIPEPLADLPWELVFDAQRDRAALSATKAAPLVRHVPAPVLPNLPPQKGALRVLVAIGWLPELMPPAAAARRRGAGRIRERPVGAGYAAAGARPSAPACHPLRPGPACHQGPPLPHHAASPCHP